MKPLRIYFPEPERDPEEEKRRGEAARWIDDAVWAIVKTEYAAIERAIEQALTGGKCGVRVDRVDGKLISVRVDPEVPYGQLHEHLTRPPGLYDDFLRTYAAILADKWYRQ